MQKKQAIAEGTGACALQDSPDSGNANVQVLSLEDDRPALEMSPAASRNGSPPIAAGSGSLAAGPLARATTNAVSDSVGEMPGAVVEGNAPTPIHPTTSAGALGAVTPASADASRSAPAPELRRFRSHL